MEADLLQVCRRVLRKEKELEISDGAKEQKNSEVQNENFEQAERNNRKTKN